MKATALFVAALFALPLAGWAAEKKKGETHLAMDQLPASVRATIEKESAGGKVEEVEKETEHGATFYEAEIVKNGKESYVHVSPDGKVLKRETEAQERKAEGAEKEEKGEHQGR
jgi:hypothetical protein